MRKYITGNGTFYYPEQYLNLFDTDEVKIIVENPVGYVEGDLVRMFYTFALYGNWQVGVNTFEMFSPLVKDGSILRAIFYLPLSVEFAYSSFSLNPDVKLTEYIIKTKGSTDFSNSTNRLDAKSSFIYLMNSNQDARSHPIPVFFFSERGAGLFANKILNRQSWVADTNFSSVAIRQDRFNPFDMEIGGRNLVLDSITEHSFANDIFQKPLRVDVFKEFIGNQLTLSFYAKANSSGQMMDWYLRMDSAPVIVPGTQHTPAEIPTEYTRFTYTITLADIAGETELSFAFRNTLAAGGTVRDTVYLKNIKIEKGNKATDWTPAPEDYEVTEVVSGADLAGGLAKFDSSYAFKLLDDSEWVTKKLICPENYIQLFWGEPRTETRFSFWFKIKEIEKSSEAWGEVEHYRELRAGTDVKERRKEVTKYRFPKTKLRLTSGVFRQDIIDKLKGIAHSTTIYKYNPYTKLNEGAGVVAQVTELRRADGTPTAQVGTGHFRLNNVNNYSNIIEELIDSPESVFDLEFSFKGTITHVRLYQNRDDLSKYTIIAGSITESVFTKKTFNGSITIDRSKKVKPTLWFRAGTPDGLTEIKDIHIKGSLGGIEDVEVEIATMNIIPRQDGEGEMELTVISDDFRKPDYLYF